MKVRVALDLLQAPGLERLLEPDGDLGRLLPEGVTFENLGKQVASCAGECGIVCAVIDVRGPGVPNAEWGDIQLKSVDGKPVFDSFSACSNVFARGLEPASP